MSDGLDIIIIFAVICLVVVSVVLSPHVSKVTGPCRVQRKVMRDVCATGNTDACEVMQKAYINCMREKGEL